MVSILGEQKISQQRYVLGFGFFESDTFLLGDFPGGLLAVDVLLVKKEGPAWQKGKWNGVGGKVELGELPSEAMAREYEEETGIWTLDWDFFCRISDPESEIYQLDCFAADISAVGKRRIPKVNDRGEELRRWNISTLFEADPDMIPNLRWLIPMALTTGVLEDRVKRDERALPYRVFESAGSEIYQ